MRPRLALIAICLSLERAVLASRCTSDACLRAIVSATKGRNTADCVSFFHVTVTPATRTVTTSVTITSTTPIRNVSTTTKRGRPADPKTHGPRGAEYEAFDDPGFQALEERQVTVRPTLTPTYASKCRSQAAYSSACSCLRVSHATTTAPTRTATRTVTVTKIVGSTTATPPSLTSTSPWTNSTVWQFPNSTSSNVRSSSTSTTSLPSASTSASSTSQPSQTVPSQDTGKSSSQVQTSSPSTNSTSVVYVVSATTLFTTSKPPWSNSSATVSVLSTSNGTIGHYWNLTSTTLNTTSSKPPFGNVTATRWLNTSITSLTSTTRPLWLNSTTPSPMANATSFRWLNTTSMISTMLANSTSVRWPNSTLRANTTTPRWLNATSTPTATPMPTIDTSCGETVSPFALQVSQPGGTFDGWFLYLVGNGVLFTNTRSSASSFSVEASGHLCVVGYLDEEDHPSIAAVGTHDPSSNVWLLRQRILDSLGGDYAAVTCTKGDGSLACTANTTNPASYWLGCGLQLDLSTDGSTTVPVNGRNCTSIGLKIT